MTPELKENLRSICDAVQYAATQVRSETANTFALDDHVELIRHYDDLRAATDRIKEARNALDEIEDQLSREHIPDIFMRHHIKTITVEGVGRVTVSYRYGCSMIDKEAGIKWLKETGNGGIVQETVNASTLSAFAKNMSETEGKDLPDDLFKVGRNPYTSITKVR